MSAITAKISSKFGKDFECNFAVKIHKKSHKKNLENVSGENYKFLKKKFKVLKNRVKKLLTYQTVIGK